MKKVVFLLFVPILMFSQASIFDMQRANIWVKNGSNIKSYYINSWSKDANISGNKIMANGSEISQLPSGRLSLEVLVNDVQTSYPRLSPNIPKLSLIGFDSPTASIGDAIDKATVSISPNGGDFNKTVAVTFTLNAPANHEDVLYYKINSESVQEKYLTGSDNSFVIYLVKGGNYAITYYLRSVGTQKTAYFHLANQNTKRDSDGDGIPDIVEVELGMNPLSNVIPDSNNNGWNDFDEYIRDNNLTDSDGDGWTDWDERLRGTDPNNPYPCADISAKPTATSLYGIEYVLTNPQEVVSESTPKPQVERVSLVDIDSKVHYDTSSIMKNSTLDLSEDNVSLRLCDTSKEDFMSFLTGGNIPTMRVAADIPIIGRVRYLDSLTQKDNFVLKNWVDSKDRVTLNDFLNSSDFVSLPDDFTAATFINSYVTFLRNHLVVNKIFETSSTSSVRVGLIESAMKSRIDSNTTILLGHPDFTPPKDMYKNTIQALSKYSSRVANNLYEDIINIAIGSNIYQEANDAVKNCDENTTTERCLAKLMQEDINATFAYKLSLMTIVSYETAQNHQTVFEPNEDTDKDGISNKDEVLSLNYTNPLNSDSDDDGFEDNDDKCPNDSQNQCINDEVSDLDSDGDGVVDSVDNCPYIPNQDQNSTIVDGIGDACAVNGIVMTSPKTNISLYQGESYTFEAIKTVNTSLSTVWSVNGDIVADSTLKYTHIFDANGTFEVCAKLADGSKEHQSCISVNVLAREINHEIEIYANDILEGNEGVKNLLVEVVLQSSYPAKTVYDYTTNSGTAEQDVDFNKTEGELVFSSGETRKYIQIPIISDTDIEDDETFTLRVGTDTVVLRILNDDSSDGNDDDDDGNDNNDANSTISLESSIFVSLDDGVHGSEPWISDGNASGTHLLKDIIEGNPNSEPANFNILGDYLYFTTMDENYNSVLFRSLGTQDSTQSIYNFNSELAFSNFFIVNDEVYFTVNSINDISGVDLWKVDTDGSVSNVATLSQATDYNKEFDIVRIGNILYFAAAPQDFTNVELYKYELNLGQNSSTLIKDIEQGDDSSNPREFTKVNSVFYFVVSRAIGSEIWKSDGTESGTVAVIDASYAAGTDYNKIYNINGLLYIIANRWDNNNNKFTQIYKIDPQNDSISQVVSYEGEEYSIDNLVTLNGKIYYLLQNNDTYNHKLIKIQSNTPIEVASFNDYPYMLKSVGNTLYIEFSTSLKSFDGTNLQTIKTWDSQDRFSIISNSLSGELYFKIKHNGSNFEELWKTDGTKQGTIRLQP